MSEPDQPSDSTQAPSGIPLPSKKPGKQRTYFFAITTKAWEEFGVIEAIGEAITGVLFSGISVYMGLMNPEGALDTVLECAGCGLLFPFVAYILRWIFTAPGELLKEAEESKEVTINPKSIYPSIVATIIAICTLLIFSLFLSLKMNFKQYADRRSGEQQAKEPPKPLPMKAIPTSEVAMPIAEAHQKTSVTEQAGAIVFEKDFVPTNIGVMGELERYQEEKRAAELIAKKAADRVIYDYWTNALPYYEQTILTLRDILRQNSATNGDVETQPAPVQFLHCLPESISPEDIDRNLGEIKLSKNTNLDFTISVGGNPDQQRFLFVRCSSGYVMVHPHPDGNRFCYGIKTPQIEYTELTCPFENSKQKVADCLITLIDVQTTNPSQTNK
jgi:hypothetical protein